MKHAIRQLLKSPGYSILAITALALGIGANTVLFSTINTLFLRPLAFPEPDRLVRAFSIFTDRSLLQAPVSWPRFRAWQEGNHGFAALAAQAFTGFTLTGRGDPEQVGARRVTERFFAVLGARPALGRTFSPEEDAPGGADVVLLNHGFWVKRFGGDTAILGQSLVLDGRPYTVIGVMPALGFPFDQNDLWAPRVFEEEGIAPDLIQRGTSFLNVIARLKPGADAAQALQALRLINRHYAENDPGKVDAKTDVGVVSLQEDLVGNQRPMFFTLLAAVGCVLLVACANIANLLLARFTARSKELAIRTALGATRRRIVAQLVGESVLTAGAGGALGVVLAVWGLRVLARVGANFIPRSAELHLDWRVLAFAVGLSLLTGVLLGLVPALHASRAGPGESLKDSLRGSSGGRSAGRLRAGLLVTEVALSLVLLIGAALLIDSFGRLQRVDPGFKTEGVTSFFVGLPAGQYPTPERQSQFFQQALERISALPGVTVAGATDGLPIVGGGTRSPAAVEGKPLPPMQERLVMRRETATPGFFSTIGVPIKAGRDFQWRDQNGQPNVVIINETLAKRLFPGENPVGQRLITGIQSIPREVVGVVGDFRAENLAQAPAEQMFYPSMQLDGAALSITVRSARPVAGLRPDLIAAIHALDPSLPINNVQPFSEQLARAVADRRLVMLLLGGFAALALLLAGMGVYSVIGYSVSQRTNEFGIRLALGARPVAVVGLVMREGLTLALAGVGVGLAAAWGLSHLIQRLLFQTSPADPAIYGGVAAFLAVVAALACFVPARRATRVDPIAALRGE